MNITQRLLSRFLALVLLAAIVPCATAQHHHHHGPALGTGVAAAPDGALWLVGLDSDARLFIESSRDYGKTWSDKRILDTGSDPIAAEGDSWPKIAFGPNGWVVISYTKPLAKPYTGEIRMLRSADGGKTFSTPFTVHQDRQVITHRFDSILFDAHGVLHTLWIDKRDLQNADAPYRGAAVYRNFSKDGGQTFSADIKVADHSCECCRIALAQGADGNPVAMWRHVFAPNVRDHAFAAFGANNAPISMSRATFDEWKVDACPHHGPGLAFSEKDKVFHAVWFGIRNSEPGVRYERLDQEGKPNSPAVLIPDPTAQHADVLADGDKVAIAWQSFDGKSNRLRAWISKDGGKHFVLRDVARFNGSTDEPRMVRLGHRLLVAWRTEQGVGIYEL